MDNMERERLKEILLNPQNFISYLDQDNWVIFKKKEDVYGLTVEEILESESYFLRDSIDFVVDILSELKIEFLNMR